MNLSRLTATRKRILIILIAVTVALAGFIFFAIKDFSGAMLLGLSLVIGIPITLLSNWWIRKRNRVRERMDERQKSQRARRG